MRYRIQDIIEIRELEDLMKDFYIITKIPYRLVDMDGAVLCCDGKIQLRGVGSPLVHKEDKVFTYEDGISEIFIPIRIEGVHVASLILGEFILTEDENDNDNHRSMISTPVISKEKLEVHKRHFKRLIKILVKAEICEKAKIEEKLMQSESRYKKLIELLPYGVSLYKNDTILFMNATGANYFGYDDPQQVIGLRLDELFSPHEDYRETFETNIMNMNVTGIRALAEEKFIRKIDGEIIYFETISSFIDNGDSREILVVFKDISEKKRIQAMYKKSEMNKKRLQEKNEYAKLRTEFFANLSHELRTPVNIIYSAIQLFEREAYLENEENYKPSKRIKIMKQNCNRIIRLVNNLIDITKIDSGYLKLSKKKMNLVNIVEDITISVADYIENKNIKLVFDTDSEEKIAYVDPNAVERIILNLLSNSVKFTNPGDEIMVKLWDEGENIAVSVKDSGIGIPKDKVDLVFDRFRQVDKSLNRNHEGSGIGLSLVKSLVRMHDGTIQLISDYGQGSEFIIHFPKCSSEDVCNYEDVMENETFCSNKYIEKIKIEFSDIYS